jgi:DNA-binding beta-propeller fold protein YncE
MAFDGTAVWSTNYGGGTVTKLRASDGKLLGTFQVGYGSAGIAFDGADVWVANRRSGTVTELRASDGAVLGTFSTLGPPYGVAFDGTYIWVSGDLYLEVLRASDGTVVASRKLQSEGIVFDGVHIWTAAQAGNSLFRF